MSYLDLTPDLLNDERCVLPYILEKQSTALADKTFIVFDLGETWSYADTHRIAQEAAATLQSLGVKRGDRVSVLLHDGPMMVRLTLGLVYLGAVFSPINPAYKGRILEDVIVAAEAKLVITEAALIDHLSGISLGSAETVVSIGGGGAGLAARVLDDSVLAPVPADLFRPPEDRIKPWDVHTIFFTSGTTGPSKGVLSTHLHIFQMAMDGLHFLDESDRYLSPSSFFHIAGPYVLWGIAAKGASVAMIGSFKTQTFWEQIRRTQTTSTLLIGAMADFLLKAPPTPDDRDSSLCKVLQQPVAHDPSAFAERFGVEIYTQFDMTEVGPMISSEPLAQVSHLDKGYCGKKRKGFDIRLVDENDCEVPIGAPGELAVRCDIPWVIASGYFRMPEATAEAWRNGWFHTGDVMRKDVDGNYFYVDRKKDVIRRRGENISSYEVETEVMAHPQVKAAAAYATNVDVGEGDVMVAIEAVADATVDPSELCEFLLARLPRFMVPRYVRLLAALPRSVTDKINKAQLREEGVTADTWDRVSLESRPKRSA